ncbi:MAG: ribosome-associated translation inhibitor RaiA [Dokdonia sp.]|jgi:putative sigma-54 modulation protein
MTIAIEFVKIDRSATLSQYVVEKLNAVYAKYDWLVGVQVYIKKEQYSATTAYICEMKVSLAGPQIFASSTKDSFEKAINTTINEIERQIEKRKQHQLTY